MDGTRIGRLVGYFLFPALIVWVGVSDGFTPMVWVALVVYLPAAVWLSRKG